MIRLRPRSQDVTDAGSIERARLVVAEQIRPRGLTVMGVAVHSARVGETHRTACTPGAQEGLGRTFNLTGQWSYRDSPVRSHALRGRPFLDLRLKPVKVGSPSPAVF